MGQQGACQHHRRDQVGCDDAQHDVGFDRLEATKRRQSRAMDQHVAAPVARRRGKLGDAVGRGQDRMRAIGSGPCCLLSPRPRLRASADSFAGERPTSIRQAPERFSKSQAAGRFRR
jgi:hypothetical protein